jgi:hypothetical protein
MRGRFRGRDFDQFSEGQACDSRKYEWSDAWDRQLLRTFNVKINVHALVHQ